MSFNLSTLKVEHSTVKNECLLTLKIDSTINIECILTLQHKVEHSTIKIECPKLIQLRARR